ncbi:hypothetical protein [Nocardia sp. SSK8]|uniref:hypothetical protein n=1 Tax=Nocardia sp. SSK8 TaxID=3120154 RepID=UPI00300BC6BB
MMRSRFGLSVLAVVMAAVSACSTTVTGTAGPDTGAAAPTAFGVPVTAADKQTFDTLDQVRSVDPCGFVDRAYFDAAGTISLLGPSTELAQCAIRFTPNGARNPSYLYIDLDHNPPLNTEPTRQIAGEPVVALGPDSYGNCKYKVPLRFPIVDTGSGQQDVVEIATVAYAMVSSSSFDSSEFGCGLAERLVTAIATAFRDDRIPRRSAAATPVSEIELLTHNPCEIVAALPLQVRLSRLLVDFEPLGCSFMVDDNDDVAESVLVTFGLTRRPLESFRASDYVISVDGIPVLIHRDETIPPPTCIETFSVGPELDPATGVEEVSRAKVQPIVNITGLCSTTEQIRPAAMRLFGATA